MEKFDGAVAPLSHVPSSAYCSNCQREVVYQINLVYICECGNRFENRQVKDLLRAKRATKLPANLRGAGETPQIPPKCGDCLARNGCDALHHSYKCRLRLAELRPAI